MAILGIGTIVLIVLTLAFAAAGYVWVSLAFAAVFRKTGSATWKAWVPVAREWELLRLAGMNPVWAIVLVGGTLLLSIMSVVIALMGVQGIQTTGLLAMSLLTLLVSLAVSILAIIVVIMLSLRLNERFGLGAGYTVLAVLVWPVWLSILGWGRQARWREDERADTTPAPPVPPPSPFQMRASAATTSGIQGVVYEPPVGMRPAGVDQDPTLPPVPPPPPPPPPPQAPPAPPAPPAAPEPPRSPVTPPPLDTRAPAPAAGSAWAPPPPPRQAAPPAADPSPTAPPPSLGHAPGPPVRDAVEAPEEVVEHTVLATRSRQRAVLVLPTGSEAVLTESSVVIGRAPDAPAELADPQVIAVDEPTRTISKTHAILERTATGWTIRDLGSTNGTHLIDGTGTEHEVTEPTRVDGVFLLGDARFELRV